MHPEMLEPGVRRTGRQPRSGLDRSLREKGGYGQRLSECPVSLVMAGMQTTSNVRAMKSTVPLTRRRCGIAAFAKLVVLVVQKGRKGVFGYGLDCAGLLAAALFRVRGFR